MTRSRTIGNDVVDLADPDADLRSFHRRFVERVFTEEEQARIRASPSVSLSLWAHWAAKESAYKALRRPLPSTPFVPLSFVVKLRDPDHDLMAGHVRHGDLCVSVVVRRTPAWLHAVAVPDPPARSDRLMHGVTRLREGEDSSTTARRLACRELAPRLGCPRKALRIGRSRPPRIYVRDEVLPVPISLSHHGSWVGYAARLP